MTVLDPQSEAIRGEVEMRVAIAERQGWRNRSVPVRLLRAIAECFRADSGRQWVLDNVFTIARRELKRLQNPPVDQALSVQRWEHVLRLCEDAGCKGAGVLRDNGGAVGEPEAADAVDPSATDSGKLTTRV